MDGAYHGSPPMESKMLASLLSNQTPSNIAKELREYATNHEIVCHFNHQNAWSRAELEEELSCADFKVESFDKPYIISRFSKIPKIANMEDISMYCIAKK